MTTPVAKTVTLNLVVGQPVTFTTTDSRACEALYDAAQNGGWFLVPGGGRCVNWALVASFTVS